MDVKIVRVIMMIRVYSMIRTIRVIRTIKVFSWITMIRASRIIQVDMAFNKAQKKLLQQSSKETFSVDATAKQIKVWQENVGVMYRGKKLKRKEEGKMDVLLLHSRS